MKITIEHLGHRAFVEEEAAHDITEAMDLIETALLDIGYAPERIRAAFLFKAEEIKKKTEY